MLYMVIERFKAGNADAIGKRFRERGRMMPEGLEYVASWLDPAGSVCFQLMKATDRSLFEEWHRHWADLMDVEIVPVQTSDAFWSSHGGKPTE